MRSLRKACSKRIAVFTLAAAVVPISSLANVESHAHHQRAACDTGTAAKAKRLSAAGDVSRMVYGRLTEAFTEYVARTAQLSSGSTRFSIRPRSFEAIRQFVLSSINELLARTPFADVGVGAFETKREILFINNAIHTADETIADAAKSALPTP